MEKKFVLLMCLVAFSAFKGQGQANANADSLMVSQNESVVVTATRTARKLSNIAVPFDIIQQKQIKLTGVMRMQELLQEQTGLFVTSGSGTAGMGGGVFGNGIQIQGMSPDYTLMLINGEPVIGRQGGTLNLARFTVANIKKVEIVKGPSSSLYGSEAMGGVVNIITEQPNQNTIQANARLGTYGIHDYTVTGSLVKAKHSGNISYNHYRFGGSDYNNMPGYTQDPFNSHTLQAQWNTQITNKTRLLVFSRWNKEQTNNLFDANVNTGLSEKLIRGNLRINDVNINPTLLHKFHKNVHTHLRLYATIYESVQQLTEEKGSNPYYYDYFQQQFYRIEKQTNINLSGGNTLSAGGGFVKEVLNTNRYDGIRTNQIGYVFVQNEWQPNAKWNIIGGFRYDANQDYASRLSPKLAFRFSPNEKFKITASFGAGFRAPDYRQLYLSLVNPAAGGYAIYGANEISLQKLQAFQQQGFINTILPRANDLKQLNPETSTGINVGLQYQVSATYKTDINIFNNDIANQIIFDIIALRGNGQQVYSYFNVKRSFTRGFEWNNHWQITKQLQFTSGYQLLLTGDKDVIQQINEGRLYGRNSNNNEVYLMNKSDYKGLPNRSKHMVQAKIFYQNEKTGWNGSLRAVYRSSWGTNDIDGNGVINRSDEMAKGFMLLNCSIGKQVNKQLNWLAGIDNILNHKDAINTPNIIGVNAYISFRYQWVQKK
ncbi:MAG: TonB-dependent receptor plug domain-containing protein [Chitinophagaceae bacterium]